MSAEKKQGDETPEGELSMAAKGGRAAAAKMTPEERSERAKKAAESRWLKNAPQATHEGRFPLGSVQLLAAVLPDGKRLLTQATFLRALGRSRSPKAGTGVLSTVDELPFFLQADVLKPFITEELRASTTPIFFRDKSGRKAIGYDAQLLPAVAEVYLKMRDAYFAADKPIPRRYQPIIAACDIIIRGLARVGIVALVDEATGFQYDRARDDLQKLLEQYVSRELARWERTFEPEFYRHIYRLKGWPFNPASSKRTPAIARITVDLMYDRIHPDLTKELKQVRSDGNKPNSKLHQWLTTGPNGGHPRLKQHHEGVVALLSVASSWDQLQEWVDRRYPKFNEARKLPFPEADD